MNWINYQEFELYIIHCSPKLYFVETPICDAATAGSVDWPETPEGSKAIMPCPGDATGTS